ncbi:MAG: flagellin [Caldimicrobium sp.]|nr:flagellin [Caldimicrobium sp.]
MAVKINFNEAAAQTHTALIRNERAMNKSLLRMSTGMRILSAADDSAGMFIADMLSTVAKAYEQGNRNISTGISALQIAEASAGQIFDKLQEIYVRAQNAANDVNDPNARMALQREIMNFVDAIQKIGTDTEYNGIRLLDGSFAGKYIHYGPRMDQTVSISISDVRAQSLGAYIASGNGGTATGVSSTAGGSLAVLLSGTGSLGGATNHILSENDYVRIADITVYRGGTTNTLVDAATLAKNINENEQMKKLQIEAKAKNISLANQYSNVITGTFSYTGSETSDSANFTATIDLRFYIGDGQKTFTVNLGSVAGTASGDTSTTSNFTSTALADLDTLVNRINTAATANNANVTAINDNGRLKLVTKNGETIAIEARVNYAESETNSGTISANITVDLGQLLQGADYTTISSTTNAITYYAAVKTGQIEIGGIDSFKLEYNGVSGTTDNNYGLYFQIASGNNVSLQSLYNIDVTTNEGAEKAIMITSKALQKADTERAKIGAVMNNLQTIFDAQKVAFDNTKEAESVIRNTDYAKEMADFTTYQIRMQATVAMLAQANTLPQLMLQLLR